MVRETISTFYGTLIYETGFWDDTLDLIRLRRHLVKRLESLGYEVTLAERKAT